MSLDKTTLDQRTLDQTTFLHFRPNDYKQNDVRQNNVRQTDVVPAKFHRNLVPGCQSTKTLLLAGAPLKNLFLIFYTVELLNYLLKFS
jgi:hypothetical protein